MASVTCITDNSGEMSTPMSQIQARQALDTGLLTSFEGDWGQVPFREKVPVPNYYSYGDWRRTERRSRANSLSIRDMST